MSVSFTTPGLEAKNHRSSAATALLVRYRWLALVLAVTFLAYAGTLGYQFVSDDDSQIVNTEFVKSWQNVPRFFTGHSWSYLDPNLRGNYYRPIALLWIFANHLLVGLNPLWWHLTTVLGHLGATLMVYLLVDRLTRNHVSAGFAALIFGLHPAHIEAVAWVSGFTEPLTAIFLIGSFLCHISSRERPSSQGRSSGLWLGLSLLLFVLALLTKETAIVLPAFVAAYEFLFQYRRPPGSSSASSPQLSNVRFALLAAGPYLILAGCYLGVRALALGGLTHPLNPLSTSTLIFTWPSVLWFYVGHLIWPVGLSGFYDTALITSPGLSNFVLPSAALAFASAALWLIARRSTATERPMIGLATAFLVLPLVPLLNLSIFREAELVHDRYLYLPSIGVSVIGALVLGWLRSGDRHLFGFPAARVGLALGLTAVLGIATAYQHGTWASNFELYSQSLSFAPNNSVAANNLANELSRRGSYGDAISLYERVLSRDSSHWAATYNLGCNYYLLGRYQEAEFQLLKAIEIRPMESKQYLTLAVTQEHLNRLIEAERTIRRGIHLKADAPGFHGQLGDILEAQGRLREARDELEIEARYQPNNARAIERLAEVETRLAVDGLKSSD